MIRSWLRGHPIIWKNKKWVYADTKKSTVSNYRNRPCGNCGKTYTKEGHDGCLGILNGIMNACCGHGEAEEAYVQFLDGFSVHGKNAIIILEFLKDVDNIT